jgi:hypothetical protein
MRSFYSRLLPALALAALAAPSHAQTEFTECPTDRAECVVEWAAADGFTPVINALRNTIANDTDRPADRVYVLYRGGLYWNEDTIENDGFDLRLRGQTAEEGAADGQNVCGVGGNEDCGPALLQRFVREDNTIEAVMIRSGGDGNGGQYLTNLWIMGQDNTGVTANYEPIVINSSNSRFVYDNVIFDRNDWHHLGFKQGGNSIFIRNSKFRNLSENTQRYGGRGIRLEAGADTVAFENNSFFNITSFPFQSESAPVSFFLFNHNTVVNHGLAFNAGGLWDQAFITNNVLTNPFYQGESEDLYTQPNRVDPFSGVFNIGAVPADFGLFDGDRRVAFANNTYGRADRLEAFYETFDPVVRAQPLVSDTTQGWFDAFPGMVIQDNIDTIPNFVSAPTTDEVYGLIEAFVEDVSTPGTQTPYASVVWDPGRDDNPLAVNWPLPEDFSYSDPELLTAGTDGLPLGDLNWFPDALAQYEARSLEDVIEGLYELVGGTPVPPIAAPVYQAEDGTLGEGATVASVEGFTSIEFEASGFAEWTFSVPSDGDYGLNVNTSMFANGERGQRIILDGVGLRNSTNYGEYFFCLETSTNADCPAGDDARIPVDDFGVVEIRPNDLIPDVATGLTLSAGAHTLRIEPSWGYQAFAEIEVVDATGSVVATLTPPEATTAGITEVCPDEEAYCPRGFQTVDLSAGGSVTFGYTVPDAGVSLTPIVTYTSASGSSGEILVDGASQGTFTFAPTADGEAGVVTLDQFNVASGPRSIAIVSNDGGVSIDFVQFAIYDYGVTAVEELPEGWSLGNSFPNPTAGTATIRFALGEAADVRLDVYDVLGRRVSTLADGLMTAGGHEVRFDARALASGTYVYRLSTPVGQQTRRLTIVR